MLVMNTPFRELDSWFDQVAGRARSTGEGHTAAMDAYRRDGDVWVHVDLPGIAADSLDVAVERNVLTITGERNWQRHDGDHVYLSERRRGVFRRQVTLGDGLDADAVEADYSDGVLTLRIPIAERAQPRKISISTRSTPASPAAIDASATEA
ncbi:MAG: Hsp20/alpha crystallin family protein [Ilumatobacter sp.]|uniref:Hsp20/alpha crystallin family protein n=1 Tax=Ilumatobacter sp. TaxID=1967498 RepID=UPI003299D836